MTCSKVQSMITPFVNNELSMQEMEGFLDHMESCPNCKEELDFYYVLLTAMKQLDEDRNLSYDYKKDLSDKIKKSQEKIIHIKYIYYRKKTLLILLMISLAFLLSIRYAEKSTENTNYLSDKDYNIRRVYFAKRYEERHELLKIYLKKQGIEEIAPKQEEHNKK